MSETSIITPLIDAMKPKAPNGFLPKVTQCPYCGISMSQTAHANHRPVCAQDHRLAPPQPAVSTRTPAAVTTPMVLTLKRSK